MPCWSSCFTLKLWDVEGCLCQQYVTEGLPVEWVHNTAVWICCFQRWGVYIFSQKSWTVFEAKTYSKLEGKEAYHELCYHCYFQEETKNKSFDWKLQEKNCSFFTFLPGKLYSAQFQAVASVTNAFVFTYQYFSYFSFSSGQEYQHCTWYELGIHSNSYWKNTGTNLTLGIYIHICTHKHIWIYIE